MTPIEKQILENQRYILIALCQLSDNEEVQGWLDNRTAETMNLLKEKESNEPCCEMPKEEKERFLTRE